MLYKFVVKDLFDFILILNIMFLLMLFIFFCWVKNLGVVFIVSLFVFWGYKVIVLYNFKFFMLDFLMLMILLIKKLFWNFII